MIVNNRNETGNYVGSIQCRITRVFHCTTTWWMEHEMNTITTKHMLLSSVVWGPENSRLRVNNIHAQNRLSHRSGIWGNLREEMTSPFPPLFSGDFAQRKACQNLDPQYPHRSNDTAGVCNFLFPNHRHHFFIFFWNIFGINTPNPAPLLGDDEGGGRRRGGRENLERAAEITDGPEERPLVEGRPIGTGPLPSVGFLI